MAEQTGWEGPSEDLEAKLRSRRETLAWNQLSERALQRGVDLESFRRVRPPESDAYFERFREITKREHAADRQVWFSELRSLESLEAHLRRLAPLLKPAPELTVLFCDEDIGGLRLSGGEFMAMAVDLLEIDRNCLAVLDDAMEHGLYLDRDEVSEDQTEYEIVVSGAEWAPAADSNSHSP